MCEIFKNNYFEEHLRTTASKHRSGFLEVFCKSCCLALINALMKYSFSVAVVQESTTCKLTKNCTPSQVFFKEFFPQVQNSDIEKCILMAASEDEFILETFLHFINSYFTFLILTSFKEERIFMIIFK